MMNEAEICRRRARLLRIAAIISLLAASLNLILVWIGRVTILFAVAALVLLLLGIMNVLLSRRYARRATVAIGGACDAAQGTEFHHRP